MNKRITTYSDLIEERERLESLLKHQREVLRNDVQAIKEEFAPVRTAMGFLAKFTKKDKGNWAMNLASNSVINLVLRKMVLARAGWFTRLLVPILAKNFTSNIIAENKPQILGKLATWINKVRGHKPAPKSATKSQVVPKMASDRPVQPNIVNPGTSPTEYNSAASVTY